MQIPVYGLTTKWATTLIQACQNWSAAPSKRGTSRAYTVRSPGACVAIGESCGVIACCASIPMTDNRLAEGGSNGDTTQWTDGTKHHDRRRRKTDR